MRRALRTAGGDHREDTPMDVATTGSRSFWKMRVTCFSTPRSVRKTRARDRRVRQSFGHQLEHLSLSGTQLADWITTASPTHELRDDAGIECGAVIREKHPATAVLVLSQYVEQGYALELVQEGAEGVG
jgi:hypothetical protein